MEGQLQVDSKEDGPLKTGNESQDDILTLKSSSLS